MPVLAGHYSLTIHDELNSTRTVVTAAAAAKTHPVVRWRMHTYDDVDSRTYHTRTGSTNRRPRPKIGAPTQSFGRNWQCSWLKQQVQSCRSEDALHKFSTQSPQTRRTHARDAQQQRATQAAQRAPQGRTETQSRTASASSTGTAKQAQKRKGEHTHHLPRATTENPTKRKHTRAKTEQHHGKRLGRENNKHKQKRRRTKKKETNSTHTTSRQTNKQTSKQTQANTNKRKQTQTNNTILSRMNPPPSEPHQPTTQQSWQMRGAGVLTRVIAPSLVPLTQRASNSIQIDPPRRNSE